MQNDAIRIQNIIETWDVFVVDANLPECPSPELSC